MTAVVTVPTTPWVRCTRCASLLYGKRLRRNLDICPECGDHRRLDAPTRLAQLVDPDTYRPLPDDVPALDPVGFTDLLPYPQRFADARTATGLTEAVLCGDAEICGQPVVLAVMDFRFLGGSLGCGVGELITRAAEHALTVRRPLLLVTASGGARMQEGVLSLMQMATVTQAVAALREAGVLTISLLTDPTYGGVAASFAMNTDLVLAERGARMGFAGPRVIQQTLRQTLPDGFQTAEFLLRHGQVDLVVERPALRPRLAALLAAGRSTRPSGANPVTADLGSTGAGTGAGTRPADRTPSVLVTDPDQLVQPDPWTAVRVARHPGRPTTLDYLTTAFDSYVELHGDRLADDCPAMVAALARLDDRHLMVVGHQKGHDPDELRARNFGMPAPAGYRKAQRVMRLAARLGLPVLTLIDTPGAHPGVAAEEQGQAGAIAESILTMTTLPVPVVAVITGEGGSGGALALAVADRVLMFANSTYSVISPEGCAAILWQDPAAAPQAARALRLTAPDVLRLGVVDGVLPEPRGGVHAQPGAAGRLLRTAVTEVLTPLLGQPSTTLVQRRRARFRAFGAARTVATRRSR